MGLDIYACSTRNEDDNDDFSFRAGSYGGYNQWRSQLCELINNIKPSVIWENPDSYVDKPFYHLINFSDCEGTISGKEAIKLHSDFNEHQSKVDELDDEYFKIKYTEWRRAFELATPNGSVNFC